MAELIVINTGPLISLSRAKLLEPVGRLPLDFICPAEVCREIETGMSAGYPADRPAWVRPVALYAPIDPVALAALDIGEAAVIQLALEQGASRVCIDERKGRHAALAVGLRVTGALGLLARAKELGLIPALRPAIDRLRREGAFYAEDLVCEVLRGVGEQ